MCKMLERIKCDVQSCVEERLVVVGMFINLEKATADSWERINGRETIEAEQHLNSQPRRI